MIRLRLLAALTLGVVFAMGLPTAAFAADVTISGTVFHDQDNDGIKDGPEPGVPGIKVYYGGNPAPPYNAQTNAAGQYTVSVPAGLASGNLLVGTGWLRSQCDVRTCAAGPGSDNDFAQNNQRIQRSIAGLSTGLTGINVGIVPDWQGGIGPIPYPGGTANSVDAAVRLSTTTTGCSDGASSICAPGALFNSSIQFQNQGMQGLTDIKSTLYIPVGDCLTGIALEAGTGVPGLSLIATPAVFDCSTRTVQLDLDGTIPAGGQVLANLTGKVNPNAALAGPGTPGCTPGAPVYPCSTTEPQGRAWVVGVRSIAPVGDPDSAFCAATTAVQYCPTGIHDKRFEPDEVDVVGHNLPTSLAGSTAFDLKMNESLNRPPPPGGFHPGDQVTFRAWVRNHGPNEANGKSPVSDTTSWKAVITFPAGTTLGNWPDKENQNPIVNCVADHTAKTVTCLGKGPIAGDAVSPALDVTVTIPSTWTPGVSFTSTATASPASTQSGESNTSNNSASKSINVT